ncbi:MAG: hypothetical protein IJ242_12430 [Clostridia bacterium]|nr:hypothetical protein [Clostridia bacterium]
MELPGKLQEQYDAVMEADIENMQEQELEAYKLRLDALYHEIEALEPDESDEEAFLDWEEMLETLDDCYDDLYELKD